MKFNNDNNTKHKEKKNYRKKLKTSEKKFFLPVRLQKFQNLLKQKEYQFIIKLQM